MRVFPLKLWARATKRMWSLTVIPGIPFCIRQGCPMEKDLKNPGPGIGVEGRDAHQKRLKNKLQPCSGPGAATESQRSGTVAPESSVELGCYRRGERHQGSITRKAAGTSVSVPSSGGAPPTTSQVACRGGLEETGVGNRVRGGF